LEIYLHEKKQFWEQCSTDTEHNYTELAEQAEQADNLLGIQEYVAKLEIMRFKEVCITMLHLLRTGKCKIIFSMCNYRSIHNVSHVYIMICLQLYLSSKVSCNLKQDIFWACFPVNSIDEGQLGVGLNNGLIKTALLMC